MVDDAMEEIRERMLAAALQHAGDVGWDKAFERALEGEDSDIGILAFGSARDLVLHFFADGDRRMLEVLGEADLEEMRVRDKIRFAVKSRLEADLAHREAVRRGISFLSLPGMLPAGVSALYGSADAMWRGIGDKSVDFNFYSKRSILAMVHGSTTLFWLDDNSEGQEATWKFLDRRIEDVMSFEGVKAKVRESCAGAGGIWGMLGRLRYPN
ncbi:MAG: COQ9 family protein [Hyphomicrobiales bacterium]|nr:COQ9 family protein [Hyphomicrobiales bacterium]MCY4032717.1 COQ9 family protein [Hyphomicrobiales bacterium]